MERQASGDVPFLKGMHSTMIDVRTARLPTREFAFFLDIDGTLLDLANRPDRVIVPAALRQDLATISDALGGALALVSGRTVGEIDRLFQPLQLPASGVHGSEFRPVPGEPLQAFAPRLPDPLRRSAAAIAGQFAGALFEDKGVAAAIHWRLCPEFGPAIQAAVLDLMRNTPGSFVTLHGHCVLEIKARSVDKGFAVGQFLEAPPFAGRKPLFIGDDVTDEAAIAAARRLGGRAYSVGKLIEGAADYFTAPQDVRLWLSRIARQAQTSAVA
jgi:trehalose 6-phosphate phosphatase